jgi:hypothetical protein
VKALSLLRNERKPFEERSPIQQLDSDQMTSTDNDPDDEQGENEDSPWELSSDSSNDNSPPYVTTDKASSAIVSSSPLSKPRPVLEMPRIFDSINFTITCLYKLPIRRPAPLDRLKHKTSIEASCYQPFDILYVMDKFPQLNHDVAGRLGKMISHRRQILSYRESHDRRLDTTNVKPKNPLSRSTKLSMGASENEVDGSQTGHTIKLAESQAASSQFTLQSKATTLRLKDGKAEIDVNALYAPSIAESKSSMASSYAGNDLKVEVPPRPKGKDAKDMDRFECPYCYVIKSISSDYKWK